jgi:hypothetical protein
MWNYITINSIEWDQWIQNYSSIRGEAKAQSVWMGDFRSGNVHPTSAFAPFIATGKQSSDKAEAESKRLCENYKENMRNGSGHCLLMAKGDEILLRRDDLTVALYTEQTNTPSSIAQSNTQSPESSSSGSSTLSTIGDIAGIAFSVLGAIAIGAANGLAQTSPGMSGSMMNTASTMNAFTFPNAFASSSSSSSATGSTRSSSLTLSNSNCEGKAQELIQRLSSGEFEGDEYSGMCGNFKQTYRLTMLNVNLLQQCPALDPTGSDLANYRQQASEAERGMKSVCTNP